MKTISTLGDEKMSSLRVGLILLCFGAFVLVQGVAFAAEKPARGTGLEVDTPEHIYVCVELVNRFANDAKKPVLSRKRIQSEVERQLRRNGIVSAPLDDAHFDYHLYVRVNVHGPVFISLVSFRRFVYYVSKGRTYKKTASTWGDRGRIGFHDSGNSDPIMKNIAVAVDIFINEYQKANPSIMEKSKKEGLGPS